VSHRPGIGVSTGAASTDSERDVAYRLRLADGFLGEAEEDLRLRRWRSAVDNAQLSVENSVKAVIARYAPIPRSHDLVGPLDELHASRRFGPAADEAMSMLKACATELGYEQHVRSDYGEEASFRTPWELFGQDDAACAVETARRARSIALGLLEGPQSR
jgi:HEPN domain-containing protein